MAPTGPPTGSGWRSPSGALDGPLCDHDGVITPGPAPHPGWLRRLAVAGATLVPLLVLGFVVPRVVLAHLAPGEALPPAPTVDALLFDWSFDPLPQILIIGSGLAYWLAFRRVNAAHPSNPTPRRRLAAWLAGLVTLEIALQGGIEHYDTILFSIHMVQHMLLVLVAAPLLILGAPITLILRVATPEDRKRIVLPILHSRVVRFFGHPIVAWVLFTVVMWGTHVTPLFDAALEDPLIHEFEHALFLGSALLFWWPVIALDPSPYRMSYPARMLYLFLQMPQSTFLAVTIYSATAPLYPHYVTLALSWGPGPLIDQQAAAALMWVWGDLTFLVAMLFVLAEWLRADEARTLLEERQADARAEALAQGLPEEQVPAAPSATLARSSAEGGPGHDADPSGSTAPGGPVSGRLRQVSQPGGTGLER
jgi:cytochrome c oxidase assembly factor CtaG